jgi:hypothetical protein
MALMFTSLWWRPTMPRTMLLFCVPLRGTLATKTILSGRMWYKRFRVHFGTTPLTPDHAISQKIARSSSYWVSLFWLRRIILGQNREPSFTLRTAGRYFASEPVWGQSVSSSI